MTQLVEEVHKIRSSDVTVLVTGESGTGKELVARAIHAISSRRARVFVPFNCTAVPKELSEGYLFGYRRGAFTGAVSDSQGVIRTAAGGTLFLDEIGDLPLPMQSKLLRAIQERHVRSLGSTQEDSVDVRVVSATHKDLAADVQAGRFRQDLYYRLNVIEIMVPPLRERREDLPALCDALLARIAQESAMPTPELSESVMQQLVAHPFSGNVRELENLLHRAVALADGEELQVDFQAPQSATAEAASPVAVKAPAAVPQDLQAYLDQQEREILVKTLRDTNFNRTAAAQRLGLSLRQIRYRIARLAIATPGSEEVDDPAPG